MSTRLRDEHRVAEEAAAWLETLKTAGAHERAAFAAWAKESPRHVRDFLLMTALDAELAAIDPQRRHAVSDAAGHPGNVVPLEAISPPPSMRPAHRSRRIAVFARRGAAIAAAGLVAALLWMQLSPQDIQRYATATGEQRTFELEDGSVVYLNTSSRVETHFSDAARDLRLLEGEALFKVRKDPARPFRVRTTEAVIQAVGTQFNVRHDPRGTRVSVIEGRVKVLARADRKSETLAPTLDAGEEARIAADSHVLSRAAADVEKVTAWRHRRLVFRTDTLADIVAEFNRYNRSPQIRLEDPALAGRRFSGVFDADDPESLAQVLTGHSGLAVERTAQAIVIRALD
jgi:transmembrane sensor